MVEHVLGTEKIVMLLSGPYNPDDRVRQEALALRDAGYEVTILAWDRDCARPKQEQIEGLEVRWAQVRGRYRQGAKQVPGFLQVWRWFVDEMKRIQPQVVHCHDFDTLPAGVWYWLRDKEVRLILDAHESYYVQRKPYVSAPFAWTIKVLERLLTPRAHLVIGACEANANYYRSRGARNVLVVSNWKNPDDFRFSSETLARKREALGVGDCLVVAYIGHLATGRIVIPLVQAIRERPSFFLILGGRGDQEEAIRSTCAGAENVYFPGYIEPDQVRLLTAVADVIFYGLDPNHTYAPYNAPNKLYEALAAGKAVLATDIGGELSRVVRSTRCGLLLPQADVADVGAALDALSNRTVLAEMQERAAQAGLTEYNWTFARQRLLAAYANLLSKVTRANTL